MVGDVSQFTLQPMANTNHKFPMVGGTGIPCEMKSAVLANLTLLLSNDRLLTSELSVHSGCTCWFTSNIPAVDYTVIYGKTAVWNI